MALRLKIWWYFSEPKPFKSKPNKRPVAADFQFSSCVIRYTLWGSCPSYARALTGASLLLLVWARSCHWDVYPWVFSTLLGCRWPESPGSFSMHLAPGGRCCAFTPSFHHKHNTHTHTTQQDCWLVHVIFHFSGAFLWMCFLTGAAVGDPLHFPTCALSSCYYIFYLFYPLFLAIFLQLWHCHITSALMWIIIIEINK